MAETQPLRALHYDLTRVPSLAAVIAPPYDVSDPGRRAALHDRSEHNVVAVDQPVATDGVPDRYAAAAGLLQDWIADGVVVRDETRALWALEQRFTDDVGAERVRRGVFARVRVTDYGPGLIRPHEQTHPGAIADRLALTRATRTSLSPIFSLYDDPAGAVDALLAPARADEPHGEATDDEGTHNRLWRTDDPATIAAVQGALAPKELLIADGHHRYETARAYAASVGGEGEHRYVLMVLVAAQDDGLVVNPTHRLVTGLAGDPGRQEALAATLREHFHVTPVAHAQLRPPDGGGPLTFGYIDAHVRQAFRCTLKAQAIADAAMPGLPDAYRALDTAALQNLILKGPLGLSDAQIDSLDGLRYARSDEDALARVLDGRADCAFVLRPSTVAQVRAVAAAGLTMPPKSTSFHPKVPTGLLFDPLV